MHDKCFQVRQLTWDIQEKGMELDQRILDLIGTLVHFKLTDDQISEIDEIINR